MLDTTQPSTADRHRPLNGAERRKLNRVLARAIGLEIIREGSHELAQLDIALLPTERVLQRWAVGTGSGIPGDHWDESRKTTLSPLDDATAIVVDQIILKAPHRYRTIARRWYCGTGATTVIARDLGVTRAGLYLEWRCTLEYFKIAFERSKHADLVSLMTRLD